MKTATDFGECAPQKAVRIQQIAAHESKNSSSVILNCQWQILLCPL
jgi:hypothetical protein